MDIQKQSADPTYDLVTVTKTYAVAGFEGTVVSVTNPDGTVAVLAFATTPPGYSITIADPAS